MWGGRPRPQPGPLAGQMARPGGRARVRGPAPQKSSVFDNRENCLGALQNSPVVPSSLVSSPLLLEFSDRTFVRLRILLRLACVFHVAGACERARAQEPPAQESAAQETKAETKADAKKDTPRPAAAPAPPLVMDKTPAK